MFLKMKMECKRGDDQIDNREFLKQCNGINLILLWKNNQNVVQWDWKRCLVIPNTLLNALSALDRNCHGFILEVFHVWFPIDEERNGLTKKVDHNIKEIHKYTQIYIHTHTHTHTQFTSKLKASVVWWEEDGQNPHLHYYYLHEVLQKLFEI
jgi:hypothetical protein